MNRNTRLSFYRTINARRVGPILLAIMASLAAGASGLVWTSHLSPLIVAVPLVAVALGAALLYNPIWALYAAVFVAFLPVHSLPNYSLQFAVLIALFPWLLKMAFRRGRSVWLSTSLMLLCFILWGIVTLFWAPDAVMGRSQLVTYITGFVLLVLLINEIDSPEKLNGLMITLAFTGWMLVLAGVGTILVEGYEPRTRLQVLGMNENRFGILTLVALCGVLWQGIHEPRRRETLKMAMSFLFIALALALTFLTGSRGSAISLLVTLCTFWLWRTTRSWAKLGLLILVLVAVASPSLLSTTLDRLTQQDAGALGGRLVIWRSGWEFVSDHPWLGAGIGNSRYAVMPYMITTVNVLEREGMALHNPVLQVWAEVGLPGLLLYLGVLGSAVWLFVWQYRQRSRLATRYTASYYALISSVFVGYMLSWLKGGGVEDDLVYFLMLALLLIPYRLGIEEEEREIGTAGQDAASERRW